MYTRAYYYEIYIYIYKIYLRTVSHYFFSPPTGGGGGGGAGDEVYTTHTGAGEDATTRPQKRIICDYGSGRGGVTKQTRLSVQRNVVLSCLRAYTSAYLCVYRFFPP